MPDWNETAKIRRDFRQSKPDDAPCMGKKTTVKKPKPFVIEYRQRPNTPRVDYFMKCDGEWHRYKLTSYYTTRTAAERAMASFKGKFERTARHFKLPARAEWRVRDTREDTPREEVPSAAQESRHLLEEVPTASGSVGAAE